jgi:ketosteroid isomerase-like protein
MKRRTLLVRLLLPCACGALLACLACGRQTLPAVNTDVEAARVRGVIDQFFSAAKRQDWDAAGELMSSDFEIYTDEASFFNKEAYVRLLKEDNLETEFMELRDLDIHVSHDGQMAWCKYRGLFQTTSHGVQSNVETAETLIFKNEGDGWKINRAHASVKMLDAPTAALTGTSFKHDKN